MWLLLWLLFDTDDFDIAVVDMEDAVVVGVEIEWLTILLLDAGR